MRLAIPSWGFRFWRLDRLALAERHRWPLWLPVALGAGVALYFALPAEPPLAVAGLAGFLFMAFGLTAFRSGNVWAHAGLALVAALLLGFCAAKLREAEVAAPVLARPMVAHLTARVVALDPGRAGQRLVLDQIRSGRLPDPPARLRVSLRKGADTVRVGQGIGVTAQLLPPPGPAEPGDSDFARAAFFARIGGVGFVLGGAETAPLLHLPNVWERLTDFVEDMRAAMTARICAQLPDREGAIASAIITGERGGISDEDEADLRDAGLAHVLAIAGLHMALMGGGLFWLVRAVLAAIPVLALNYPIKKWAALAALFAAAFYLIISGASVSASRAFVMLAMMLLAVLLDRPALSMRSLALAAAILLLLRPESIVEPGFQMSFAAVASLIAVAEWEQARAVSAPRPWLLRHLRAIALTSLVASFATLPFAIFYFGRATHYAVLGNLLAMPVMGLLVMPAAAFSVAAMPLGLEAWPLRLMGWGIDLMLRLGHFVSDLPGAVTVTRAFPISALILIALGGLWLAIWRKSWRAWGLVPVAMGLALALAAPRPDLLVGADARTVALRGEDGLLHFARRPTDRYAATRWLIRDGDSRDPREAVNYFHCDGEGCVARVPHFVIAAPTRPGAPAADCALADIVVSAAPIADCAGPRLVLNPRQIAAGGGYAVRFSPLGAASVNDWRGARPWVPRSQ